MPILGDPAHCTRRISTYPRVAASLIADGLPRFLILFPFISGNLSPILLITVFTSSATGKLSRAFMNLSQNPFVATSLPEDGCDTLVTLCHKDILPR
jgi:hypothetical protein